MQKYKIMQKEQNKSGKKWEKKKGVSADTP